VSTEAVNLMSYNEFRAAALVAAERGWPVFPLRPNSKLPAIKQWGQQATTDESQIHRWWSGNSRKNVGIACGPAGLLVVDLDVPHGREAFARRAWQHGAEDPRDTYTVSTPSVINGCSSRLTTVFDERCRPPIRLVESELSGGVIQRAGASGSGRVRP
jgi:hypothetical protein